MRTCLVVRLAEVMNFENEVTSHNLVADRKDGVKVILVILSS